MSQQRFDHNIPVLTELFVEKGEPVAAEPAQARLQVPAQVPAHVPAQAPAQTQTLAQPQAQAGAQDGTSAELEARALEHWTEPEWTLLERRLSERILQQLQGRVDFVLEQRLRDSMEEVLRDAMAALTMDIRNGLQRTIDTIVTRAVAQEIAHLQTLKK